MHVIIRKSRETHATHSLPCFGKGQRRPLLLDISLIATGFYLSSVAVDFRSDWYSALKKGKNRYSIHELLLLTDC